MTNQLLVIEGDGQVRENIAELLTLKGYTVTTASDGREGIRQALLHRPDLILCDTMMPQADGYQVLETIRADHSLATVPFIFLTAKADATDLRRAMNLGADDYLTKPFQTSDLLTAIESRLGHEKRRAADVLAQVENHWNRLSRISAHEYNTPLTSILGFAYLLKDPDEQYDREQAEPMLDMIITSCLRLKRTLDNHQLTNELLMISSPVHPSFITGTSRLSAEVVNQTLDVVSGQYDREGDSQTDVADAVVGICEEYLRKVLEELLDNALKFSPATSRIQVVGCQHETTYQLSITSQGRGMTPENIAAIAPYTQFGRALHEQQGGGLGLFITKKLVELNKGQLSISSHPDGPTTVTVSLPIATENVL